MAVPLNDRNLSICTFCYSCIKGSHCRYAKRAVSFKKPHAEKNSPEYWAGYYAAHREVLIEKNKKWFRDNPDGRDAQSALNKYLRTGKIEKPIVCANCKVECRPEAHHPDYDDPFAIIWLCQSCHRKFHRGSITVDKELTVYL